MNLLNAPERGMMYALYADRVIYKPYQKEQLDSEEVLMKDLLELHLFDDEKEYRYIKKRKGNVEVCVDDESVSYDDKYMERIYTLEKEAEKPEKQAKSSFVEVVNYITYDENDLMAITNYRLKEVRD